MELKEYLLQNNIKVKDFSVKCMLHKQVIYNLLSGGKCYKKTAKKVLKHTDGEVVITDIYTPDNSK